uniref:Uncharacterized protein n=1 Tax=Klebsiella pneumoniae TaxID=573 RepID=A0A7G3LDW0_KLEPN|nr:hypothetical protein [Klebsiella pneumoniae]QEQ71195.1 hypothetical protein [Klebsiella pneumoniae]
MISLFAVFTFFPQRRHRRKGIFRWLRAQKSQGEKIRARSIPQYKPRDSHAR